MSSNTEALKRDLWSMSPRCECCSSVKYECTANKPCEHCTHLYNYVAELLNQRDSTLKAQASNNMKPLREQFEDHSSLCGNCENSVYMDDHEIDEFMQIIEAHESTLKAEYEEKARKGVEQQTEWLKANSEKELEEKVRQARVDELKLLIEKPHSYPIHSGTDSLYPSMHVSAVPVAKIKECIAELNTPKNGELS